jgi:hypothetical protein
MPRFVILRHESPGGLHWDLMLEAGESLRTWALPQPPEPHVELACRALPDHRLAYLDYEGPVSGNRGSVTRWDQGTYTLVSEIAEELVVELRGGMLVGRAILRRLSGQSAAWSFRMD